MTLIAKAIMVKIKKPGKMKAGPKLKAMDISKVSGPVMKRVIKSALSASSKALKMNVSAGKSAQALIKKLKKNKGIL